jgi:hypothetical protein
MPGRTDDQRTDARPGKLAMQSLEQLGIRDLNPCSATPLRGTMFRTQGKGSEADCEPVIDSRHLTLAWLYVTCADLLRRVCSPAHPRQRVAVRKAERLKTEIWVALTNFKDGVLPRTQAVATAESRGSFSLTNRDEKIHSSSKQQSRSCRPATTRRPSAGPDAVGG